jgi:hypothetical protein
VIKRDPLALGAPNMGEIVATLQLGANPGHSEVHSELHPHIDRNSLAVNHSKSAIGIFARLFKTRVRRTNRTFSRLPSTPTPNQSIATASLPTPLPDTSNTGQYSQVNFTPGEKEQLYEFALFDHPSMS